MFPSKSTEAPKVIVTEEASGSEDLLKDDGDGTPDNFRPNARFLVVLTSLFLMIFVVAVNDGILGVALPVRPMLSVPCQRRY